MGNSKVVLIVEDEKLLREIVRIHLDNLGFHIIEAENGQEALKIASERKIDLIISDIQMPVTSGIELLKAVRRINAGHPPFVFTTAFSDISSEEALALGAEAFLRKPLAKRDLIEIVEKALVPRQERWVRSEIITESARRLDFMNAGDDGLSGSNRQKRIEIGQGGMFLPLTDDFPSGFEVLRFKVDSGLSELGVLEGFGQVRWVRQEAGEGELVGIGVEFLQLEEYARLNLLKYLDFNEPKAYIPLGLQHQDRP